MIQLAPGQMLWQLRQRFRHGLRTAYYRDIVRPRILSSAPLEGLKDRTCELHVLTSTGDWLNLIWSLKSFYQNSGRRYALCIHDDGSLPVEARRAIAQHFPDGRLIDRPRADAEVLPTLAQYPRARRFRETNLLAPKLFDFVHYLEGDRMLLFDSDLVFFRCPDALLQRIEDPSYQRNSFNEDVANGYTAEVEELDAACGVTLAPRINSGLGLVHRQSIRRDWIETFLAVPEVANGHFWRIEQTLYALCSSKHGVELLPADYTLRLTRGIGNRPFRHYVGAIRHLMYDEAIPVLVKGGLLARSAA